MTQKLSEADIARLHGAVRATLCEWTDRLRADAAGACPDKVTAFRPGMAVDGHALVRAFDAIGWGWGGRWSGAKDYQHFSATGR